jgi:hypothetical protein
MKRWALILGAALWTLAPGARAGFMDPDFDPSVYEEPAGANWAVLMNPADSFYGLTTGWGLWLRNTPVFADYRLDLFNNGIEDAFYGGFGLTLRLMPHWRVAPFAGGGGSYNWTGSRRDVEPVSAGEPPDRGQSYGAGYVDVGVRVQVPFYLRFIELSGRYTWPSLEAPDRDYWLIAIGTGLGW